MKRTSLLITALAVAACTSSVKHDVEMPGAGDTPLAAAGGGFTVALEGGAGHALPTYHHAGGTFIEGVAGDAYSIRVDNPTGQRVEAVITVDGRDVVSGDVGDYSRQRGYIIEPHGNVRISGFRQSMDGVAQFRFTSPGDSYSARRGTPENVGVIGVALFRERAPVALAAPLAPLAAGDDDRAAEKSGAEPGRPVPGVMAEDSAGPADRGAPARSNIGTQYGETKYSPVVETAFVRGSDEPDALLAVYYDTHQGLIARGVLPPDAYRVPPRAEGPQPFPENRRFAPPPGN